VWAGYSRGSIRVIRAACTLAPSAADARRRSSPPADGRRASSPALTEEYSVEALLQQHSGDAALHGTALRCAAIHGLHGAVACTGCTED
jgi:hypothetical protein